MDKFHAADALFKAPRPDERRVTTDQVFRQIVDAEKVARLAKSERLRQARIEAQIQLQ